MNKLQIDASPEESEAFEEELDLQEVTVSQTEQKKRIAETTIHETGEELEVKPDDRPQSEVALWSQEAHESVQGSSSQHLREGIEFSSKEAGTIASATLSQEIPNAFQTRIQPVSEEVVSDTTDRKVDRARASVGSREVTQHIARIQPVAESTQDHVDSNVFERGKASLTKQTTDKHHTTTIQQTGEVLKKRAEDAAPKQKATLLRETGDIDIITSSQTVTESLMNRKNDQMSEKAKASIRREAKSKTPMTTVETVGEAAADYDHENDVTERATISHEEPEKVASTKIQTVSESVKVGIEETKRKTSRASISQSAQEIRPTQTIQITGEAYSEQPPMKPESAKAKMTQDNFEASQMQTAQTITAEVAFDARDEARRTSVAKVGQEEAESVSQTTIEEVGEFVGTDSEDFRPETEKATLTLETPSQGHVKSVEVTTEKTTPRKEIVEERGKAEIKQKKLKTTKTTVEAVGEFVTPDAEDFKLETDRATVGMEKPRKGHVKTVEVTGEEISGRKKSIGEVGKAQVKQDKLEPTKTSTVDVLTSSVLFKSEDTKSLTRKAAVGQEQAAEPLPATTYQTVSESVADEETEEVPKEKAFLRPESPEAGLVETTSTTEESLAEAPKAKPRKEKAKKVLGNEKLEATHAKTVQTATGEEILEKEKPVTDVASLTKIQSQTAASTTVQAVEGTAEYRKSEVKKSKAQIVQEEQEESHEQTFQPITERVKPGVDQVSLAKERATVVKDTTDATLRTVQPVSEEVTVDAKQTVVREKAELMREEPGQTHVTKIQHVDETVSYEPTKEIPESDKARVVQTTTEITSAQTTQNVIEEVAESRKEKVPEKAKAKPKQDKLKPVGKTQIQTAAETAKPVETDETSSRKATISIEESERVLPTRGVETATEKVTEREKFERPEEVTALVSEEVEEIVDLPTVSREAKIIEVRLIVLLFDLY